MKYVLVEILLDDEADCWAFDNYTTNNMHNTNVFVHKIMDLTEEEAMVWNNRIAVNENTSLPESIHTLSVYRLIPEDKFGGSGAFDNKLEIPENIGVICDFSNIMTVKSEKDKHFINIYIRSMENIKSKIKELSLFHSDMMDNIESHKFDGFYYHKEMDKSIIHRHKIYFFNIKLNEILSKIPYEQFEEEMRDKAYTVIQQYLKHVCDNDPRKVDSNKIDVFFNMDSLFKRRIKE